MVQEMNNLISIIIPVHNVEKYLTECLDSVVNQSYPYLEIILVDDGSTDRSGEICDEWEQKDKRIRVIHQDNKGVASARNRGLSNSNGYFIGFVDPDDWCETSLFERLIECMEKNNADAVMCGFFNYLSSKSDPVKMGTSDVPVCTYEQSIIPIIEYKGYCTSLWNKLFKREVVFTESVLNEMDIELSYGEDEAWLFKILKNCNQIAFLPEPLYHWRHRDNSASHTHIITDKELSLLEAKRIALSYFPKDEEIQNIAKGRIYNDCFVLKVVAYSSGDSNAYLTIIDYLEPLKSYWKKSKDVRSMRRIKVYLVDFLMHVHFPNRIVEMIYNVR